MNGVEVISEKISETGSPVNIQNQSMIIVKNNPVPKYIRVLREIFLGLTGVHGVYVFVNYLFKNYPGLILSSLLVISAIYTHFDRRVATYSLNAAVELLLSLTIAFSVYLPVQGFEKYFDDENLRRITMPQLFYCGLFIIISIILARFEHKNSKKDRKNSKEN
ncbi:hypothetical protein FG386_000378 [Cryptosporidium ryanae]|uniref:uncharacterized protein n=1 Tax=Cryptosporidium ryanae TaxID=515981 RepID=UPI00351A9ADE|nr:hypothetical protein FG386_000378 [Cryptosporidium ryanae]